VFDEISKNPPRECRRGNQFGNGENHKRKE
jgi:hypothetical protein